MKTLRRFVGFCTWKKLAGIALLIITLVSLAVNRFYIPDDVFLLGWLQRTTGVGRGSHSLPADHVCAHRGYNARDNTEKAVRNAIEAGATFIELDLRRCKSGWCLFHDEETRTGQKVSRLTLAEIREEEGSKEIILLTDLGNLVEAFQHLDLTWVLDIKDTDDNSGLLKSLPDVGISPKNAILLGVYDVLKDYKSSEFPLAYCAGFTTGNNRWRFILGHNFIHERCQSLGSNLKHLVLPSPFLRRSLIEEAHSDGLQVWAYAVVDPSRPEQEYRNWLGLGISGIIIDHLPVGLRLK